MKKLSEKDKKLLDALGPVLNWLMGDHEEYKRYSFTLNFDGKRDGNRCTVKEIRVKLAEVIEIKGIQDERPN